jgi:hypothetical protein
VPGLYHMELITRPEPIAAIVVILDATPAS